MALMGHLSYRTMACSGLCSPKRVRWSVIPGVGVEPNDRFRASHFRATSRHAAERYSEPNLNASWNASPDFSNRASPN